MESQRTLTRAAFDGHAVCDRDEVRNNEDEEREHDGDQQDSLYSPTWRMKGQFMLSSKLSFMRATRIAHSDSSADSHMLGSKIPMMSRLRLRSPRNVSDNLLRRKVLAHI
jgi:hypothetical protein